MNLQAFFKNNWIHFVAVALFIIVAASYFAPQFDGYALEQDDIEKFKGMTNEIAYHREVANEEPLWTNAMFGGMPATQVSVIHKGSFAKATVKWFLQLFPSPAGLVILHLLCYYFMALLLRIKPIIGILGAFAFAFASYEIVILHAGHTSKSLAVAFLPLVLGAFVYAYRRSWLWGGLLSAIAFSFQLSANHLQVTYYLAILLFFVGVYFLIEAIRKKEIKKFAFTSGAVIGGYLLAMLINYGNLTMTNEYTKYTMRGDDDLTINADGTPKTTSTGGLDIDYMTQWSYGKSESLTLLSPYIRGSHSGAVKGSDFYPMAEDMLDNDELDRTEFDQATTSVSMYWGDQPGTSGPVYIGVIVVFLALLGIFFLKDKIKWVYLGVAFLALLFAWGNNVMGLTEFFADYLPLYNKFRAVTIAMVLIELLMPLLGVLVLQQLWENREGLKEQKRKFLLVAGGFLLILIGMKVIGPDRYSPKAEIADRQYAGHVSGTINQLQFMERQNPGTLQNGLGINPNDPAQLRAFAEDQADAAFTGMKKIRKEMYTKSVNRSLLFGVLGIGLCGLFFFTSFNATVIVGGLAALIIADLVAVDQNYISKSEDDNGNYKNWMDEGEKQYPIMATKADEEILQRELSENPALKSKVDQGIAIGRSLANETDFAPNVKRRIEDSYKFQALGAATNYRVFSYNDGWNGTNASYFHKSLGGYSAVKLRRIQNAFDFHISNSNNEFFNMMNVKYFIQDDRVQLNPEANGNAWAVKEVKVFDSPNDEIRALGKSFELKSLGDGRLLVNNNIVKTAKVYGPEKMVYVTTGGDSVDVRISNGIEKDMTAVLVEDAKGTRNLVPEFSLKNDTLNSFQPYVSITCLDDFNSKEEAVVSKEVGTKLSKKYSGEASVRMMDYAPNKLTYEVDAKGKQLIVFSEMHYPIGWKATIDGKETDILRVNYLLRGMEVGNGKHKVEFTYDLPKYHQGNMMASIGSGLLLLLLLALIFMEFRKKQAEKKSTVDVK